MKPVGVLLANLGTPDAPTVPAVRRYLREFLSDRRVVDLPPALWRPFLEGVVLRTRPKRSAALYRNVWTPEGSPLRTYGEAQARGVAARLGDGFRVELGMRYGSPAISAALDRLVAASCATVVVLPLFPQFSCATTLSVLDAVSGWARPRRDLPSLVVARSFPDHPAWVAAVAATVRRAGVRPNAAEPLVVSFHGIPKKLADAGDPYPRECERTARALARALNLADDAWTVAFQSRFGRARWLEPFAFETLARLARDGVRSVAVVSPSFVADCLETLDEIEREGRRVFADHGGASFVRVPCPNDSPEALDALAAVVREHVPCGVR
jgi:ferrochelatase